MSLTPRSQPYSPLYLFLFGVGGLAASLFGAWLVITILLRPPMDEIITLFSALAGSAVISLFIGFVATYYTARVSPSLLLTLIIAYLWTALLMIMNVWNGARLMFFNIDHDLPLAISLLVFASILAAAFGLAVTMRVVGDLRELSRSASLIARGEFSARAIARGRDEVSQVALSFNEMAGQLEEAEEIRRELNQLRKDLIAWTSHDLRTPLTSMRAMVE
ncbi:MAG: HAMP domain-containing protein, partial [Chloroflexota bacterium]